MVYDQNLNKKNYRGWNATWKSAFIYFSYLFKDKLMLDFCQGESNFWPSQPNVFRSFNLSTHGATLTVCHSWYVHNWKTCIFLLVYKCGLFHAGFFTLHWTIKDTQIISCWNFSLRIWGCEVKHCNIIWGLINTLLLSLRRCILMENQTCHELGHFVPASRPMHFLIRSWNLDQDPWRL